MTCDFAAVTWDLHLQQPQHRYQPRCQPQRDQPSPSEQTRLLRVVDNRRPLRFPLPQLRRCSRWRTLWRWYGMTITSEPKWEDLSNGCYHWLVLKCIFLWIKLCFYKFVYITNLSYNITTVNLIMCTWTHCFILFITAHLNVFLHIISIVSYYSSYFRYPV